MQKKVSTNNILYYMEQKRKKHIIFMRQKKTSCVECTVKSKYFVVIERAFGLSDGKYL